VRRTAGVCEGDRGGFQVPCCAAASCAQSGQKEVTIEYLSATAPSFEGQGSRVDQGFRGRGQCGAREKQQEFSVRCAIGPT
jgi:hypothetical protein